MLYRDISKILGIFLLCLAGFHVVPIGIAFYQEYMDFFQIEYNTYAVFPFFLSMLISSALGLFFYWIGRRSSGNIYRREGLIAVVLIWFLTPAICAMPLYFSGTLANPYQAYFETTSGLTTTGITVLQAKKFDSVTGEEIPIVKTVAGVIDTTYTYWGNIVPVKNLETGQVYTGVEAVRKSLLFWRSFTQWIGGGGIILLFMTILPALGVGGKVLFQAEITGPVKDSLTPRLKESAGYLWKIYIGLTLLQVIMLMVTNDAMGLFDAVTISFTTLSTGGFSVHNESIGYYQNASTEWVVIFFMILGSLNFNLYFFALHGKLYRIYEPEFLLYMAIIFVACCIGIPLLVGKPELLLSGHSTIFNISDSIRVGVFQIVSAVTSTGFAVINYDAWPYALQVLLLVLAFVGGMSGSTAGGIKIIRHYMLFRINQNKIESLFRPETVRVFRIGDREVDSRSAILVLCFFLTVVASAVFGTFVYVITGIDPETSIGLISCMLNNTGLGFRAAGPTESAAFMTDFQLIFSSFLMILGRLEYFAVLAILVPAFWKKQ